MAFETNQSYLLGVFALFWSLVQVRTNFSFSFWIIFLYAITNSNWIFLIESYIVFIVYIFKRKKSIHWIGMSTQYLLWSCIYFLGNFLNQDIKINKNSFMRNILGCLVNAWVQILDWNIFLKGKKYHIHNNVYIMNYSQMRFNGISKNKFLL